MIAKSKAGDTALALPAGRKFKFVAALAACRFVRFAIVTALFAFALAEPASAQRGGGQPERGVYKARITPHWFAQNTQFWYRNDLRAGTKEFVRVNAEFGTREPAFDHRKLAAALSKAAGGEFQGDKLPFSEIELTDDGKAVKFSVSDKSWRCDLNSYVCTAASTNAGSSLNTPARSPDDPQLASADVPVQRESSMDADLADLASTSGERASPQPQDQPQSDQQSTGRRRGNRGSSLASPDAKWTALVRDYNVFIRSEPDGKEIPLSQDGKEGNYYERLEWSPDSQTMIAWRVEPGDRKEVYLVQSSPSRGGRAEMRARPYAQAGDKFTRYEINVFDIAGQKQIKPDVDRFEHEYESPQIHWTLDKRHFAYLQEDRGHQRLRVINVDCQSGAVRNFVDEKTQTFFWTAHTENLGVPLVSWLEKSDDFIYVSEMDGWRHFYLVDGKEGMLKKQITKGEWVVRGLDKIDEEAQQIWFRAGGMNSGQDPYFVHYYRVNFDGTGLVALTEGNGNHTIHFSPDRKFIVDAYSRVDMPPVHELRRASNGKLVCKLEEADISELKENGWQAPGGLRGERPGRQNGHLGRHSPPPKT